LNVFAKVQSHATIQYNNSDRHPTPRDIFWIIEVANTSLNKDLKIKAAIYAMAEIQEYWVLNLAAKQMIVFRNPQNGKYVEEYAIEQGTVTPLAFADISVSVERLLL
jgi:Uma2 family endonuclease